VAVESPLSPVGSQAANETTGRSVVVNGLWNSLNLSLPQVFSLTISIAAARFLGPSGMGRQSFIAFTMISISQVLGEGMNESLMRSIGEARGADRLGTIRGLVRWALPILLFAGLAGGAALVLAGVLGAEPQAAWLLAGIECVLLVAQGVPWAVLSGSQKWRQASTVGVVAGLCSVPITIAVLALGGGIVGMFAVELLATVGALTAISVFARKAISALPARVEVAPDLRERTKRYAVLATIMTFATFVVWQRSEFFFLQAYSTDREIAFYSIAFAFANGLALLPGALAGTLSPAFATLHGARDYGRIRSGYWRAQRLLPIASLPLLAGSLALGPALITLLYGEAYAGVGPVLRIMLLIFPLIPMLVIASALLIGVGVLSVALACEILGGAATIALNFLLVPSHAATGAAVADVGGQLVALVPLVAYASTRVRPAALDLPAVGRAIAASAPTGIAAWAVEQAIGGVAGLLLGLLAGVVVFVPLAILLHVVPRDDREWVADTVSARLGERAGRFAVRLIHARPDDALGSGPAEPAAADQMDPPRGRLVVYSDAPQRGGAERALGYLIGALDPLIEVTVVGVEPAIVAWIAAQRPGTAEMVLARVERKWQLWRILAHVWKIGRIKPDVLHASLSSPWSCQYGLLAGILSPGTSVVAVENASVPSSDRLQRTIKRAISRGLAAHVAVGDSSARQIERQIGLKAGSLVTIANGVPDLVLAPRAPESGRLVIGTVSRIGPQKGIELIVRALAELPAMSAEIVGEGPVLADVRALAEQLGVADRLETPGFDPSPRARLATFDVFVLPTEAEAALPLAIIEAMLSELSVIATNIPSIAESFLEGETGLLVAPGDIDGLVRALARLGDDPALRRQMGARARAFALERFGMARMAEAYEGLYREIAVGRGLTRW
jgi:glycosyltransferase involved in cell wall biosynthesis/O-antigen/teichoic acid export membrane protein